MKKRSSILALLGAFFAFGGQASATDYNINYGNPSDVGVTASSFSATGHNFIPSLSFVPEVGTILKVVDIQGLDFVVGRFTGLPHGQVVNLSYEGKTYPFVMNYFGGDGNDVVLHWEGTLPYAWGQGAAGKLGDATTVNKLVPVPVVSTGVLAGKTVLSVASGGNHTLALCSDGKVYAWGDNASGQLGINTTEANKTSPVAVNTTSGVSGLFNKTVVAIAAGTNFSLALDSDGVVYAWGYNNYGACGVSGTAVRRAPVAVDTTTAGSALTGKVVVGIAAGSCSQHSLARLANGDLVAWGRNVNGCLGDGTTVLKRVPTAVRAFPGDLLNGRDIVSMAAGLNFTLALCADGTVASWGVNNYGQLGRGVGNVTSSTVPVWVNMSGVLLPGTSIRAVSAGSVHSQALRSDGRVLSWGRNYNGQLGVYKDDIAPTSNEPYLKPGAAIVHTGVSAGEFFSVATTSDKRMISWGLNDLGQRGVGRAAAAGDDNGTTDDVHKTNMDSAHTFVSGSAGDSHAVAIVARPHVSYSLVVDDQGIVKHQELIDFGARSSTSVVLITKTFTIKNNGRSNLTGLSLALSGPHTQMFAVGALSSVNLAPDATATFTVNFNFLNGLYIGVRESQLAINCNELAPTELALKGRGFYNETYSSTNTAELVFSPSSPVPWTAHGVTIVDSAVRLIPEDIASGLFGRDVMLINNTSSKPIDGRFSGLPHGQDIVLVESSGAGYAYCVDYYGGDGNDLVLHWLGAKPYGWGSNGGFGGSIANAALATPVNIASTLNNSTIVKVVRGEWHTLVLTSTGAVAGWGINTSGQLGDNSTVNRTSPVWLYPSTPTVGKKIVDIAAGAVHSMALCSDGTVLAWGNNAGGQLGDNTVTNRLAPVAVNAASGVSAIYGKTISSIACDSMYSLILCSDGTLAGMGAVANNGSITARVPTALYTNFGGLRDRKVAEIEGNSLYGMARSMDGKVSTLGTYPQLVGNGVNSVLDGRYAKNIAGGGLFGLILCADNTVVSYGQNGFGQLGNNTTSYAYSGPVLVNTDSGVSALHGKTVASIKAGGDFSLAFCSDGTLTSWGSNLYNQLGTSAVSGSSSVPVLVDTSTLPAGHRFTGTMSAGEDGVTAMVGGPQKLLQVYEYGIGGVETLRSDNSSADFGYFYSAPNITGTATKRSLTFLVKDVGSAPVNVTGISVVGTAAAMYNVDTSNYPFITVNLVPNFAGSYPATLRITSDSLLGLASYDIHLNGYGGVSYAPTRYESPADVPLIIPAGHGTFTASGFMVLSLGFEPTVRQELMVVKNDSNHIVQGYFNNLTQGAYVSLYGSHGSSNYIIDYYGGDGNDVVLVPIAAGNRHFAWGKNTSGQLAFNNTVDAWLPYPPPTSIYKAGPLGYKRILSMATGANHTLALCSNGQVYAWGDNTYGQLGTGDTNSSSEPVAVNISSSSILNNSRVLGIAAGQNHSLAMYQNLSDGRIYIASWGKNTDGQLGDGTFTDRLYPVQVSIAGAFAGSPYVDRIYSIAAGDNHSMARYLESMDSVVSVATWGKNDYNQLGRTVSSNANVPHRVDMGTATAFSSTLGASNRHAKSIAAGGNHCLAIRSDGAVVGWGRNTYGQVGDGTTVNAAYAVAVSTTFGPSLPAVGISGGANHSLAFSQNTVYGWGENDRSQVTGSSSHYTSPQSIGAFSNTKMISAGNKRSYLLTSDNQLYGWGSNENGYLGNNGWELDLLGVYTHDDVDTPQLLSSLTLQDDEFFINLSKGASGDHMIANVVRTSEKPAFIVGYAFEGVVLEHLDTLHIGPTGDGSDLSDPAFIFVKNTGTADMLEPFVFGITDAAVPGPAYYNTTYLPILIEGDHNTIMLYRNGDYPGDYDGVLSISHPEVEGAPFELNLDGY